MANQEYEYRGLMASLWDFFRGDTSSWEDRHFYLDAIGRFGQPVLDVGCGTGRLLVDYQAQDIDIDGVDNSPEMIELLQHKAAQQGLQPRVYLQPMQALDLPRMYATIIVPSSSFQLIIDASDAAQAMQRFHAHLLPGGVLLMPLMIIWKEGQPLEEKWVKQLERQEDGAVATRTSHSRYDPTQQIEHTQDHYLIVRNGQVLAEELHQRSPATRWYSQEQAIQLFRDAGFVNIQVGKGFSFDPAEPDDDIFSLIGHRRQ